MQPFPTIDQAYDWYVATRDGLASLGSCVWMSETRLNITDKTLDELFGMTESEWNAYYELNLDKHELFSALSFDVLYEKLNRIRTKWRDGVDDFRGY